MLILKNIIFYYVMTTYDNEINNKLCLKFYCEKCNYTTSKKSSFVNHNESKRHKNNLLTTNDNANYAKLCLNKYTCESCEKIFNDRAGLWRHKKKCTKEKIDNKDTGKTNDIHELTQIMKYLMKENSEMKHMMLEQQHMMMKVIENGTHSTTNNNTNSHNNTFNLQFFLNETCKNALNIDDFVSSVKVSLSELENTGRRGYVEGISNIIINKLNKLSHCDRPLHCSDEKRETMYIKNDNQWIKETEEKPILKKAIKTIANENIKQINTWRQQHPDCTDADSNKNNLYLKIVSNSMCGSTKEESEKNYEKIISNVAKQVVIDK
jgi:hypothetical protein